MVGRGNFISLPHFLYLTHNWNTCIFHLWLNRQWFSYLKTYFSENILRVTGLQFFWLLKCTCPKLSTLTSNLIHTFIYQLNPYAMEAFSSLKSKHPKAKSSVLYNWILQLIKCRLIYKYISTNRNATRNFP